MKSKSNSQVENKGSNVVHGNQSRVIPSRVKGFMYVYNPDSLRGLKTMNEQIEETETEIIYKGDLILEADFKTEKNLIVKGNIRGIDNRRFNINAGDIDAWTIDVRNINALDINAGDIDAWTIDVRNINALDINAWDINALDIICENRIKKDASNKTFCRIFIENKSKLERKEQ